MASKKAMYEYGVGGGDGGGGRSGRSYSVGSKGMFGYGCGYGGALYSDNGGGGCKKSSVPSRFGDSGYKSSSSSNGSHSNSSGNGTTAKVGTQVFVRYSTSALAEMQTIPQCRHLSEVYPIKSKNKLSVLARCEPDRCFFSRDIRWTLPTMTSRYVAPK